MQDQTLTQWVTNHYHQNFVLHNGQKHYCREKFIELGLESSEPSPEFKSWQEQHYQLA